jgi:selenocysteine lyase/cysteine desulfurase
MSSTPISEQQIAQLRSETKGVANKIHFNNAGASMPPDVVVDAVVNYLHEEALIGGYEAEAKYKEELDGVHQLIARLINAETEEIALVENASVAWGLAFNGIDFKPGDEIITSEMEYVTNLLGLLNAKKNYGIEIKLVPNDEHGNFSLKALEDAISPRTKLIAVTHIPSTAGGMIPIAAIGKIARKHDILYLVDACQSAGHYPLDVKAIDCDMLAVTGRKYLRAPRGTGFLFVRKLIQDKLKLILMDGFSAPTVSLDSFTPRNDARRFELYERNRALTIGLGKAVAYALNIGVDRIWQRVQYLADTMREKLAGIEGITVHDTGDEQCGIVTFSVKGVDSLSVKNTLGGQNINVSVGKAISTLFYMEKNHLSSVVRASVHYYNTEDEIGVLCDALAIIVK